MHRASGINRVVTLKRIKRGGTQYNIHAVLQLGRVGVELRVQYLFIAVHYHSNQILAGPKLNIEWTNMIADHGNG